LIAVSKRSRNCRLGIDLPSPPPLGFAAAAIGLRLGRPRPGGEVCSDQVVVKRNVASARGGIRPLVCLNAPTVGRKNRE
jgi:hypothetical protein